MIYKYYWIIKSTTLGEHKMNFKTLDIKDIKPLILRMNQG